MNSTNLNLTERSHAALADATLQTALGRATGLFVEKRREAAAGVPNWEVLRTRAQQIKEHTVNHLDYYLQELVEKVTAHGGQVVYARTGEEVCRYIIELAKARGVKSVVKGKSMTTEEIELNHALAAAEIRPFETDLGEYIIQLAEEKPSHIIVPAIHKTREQVGELFAEKLGIEYTDDVEKITAIARNLLRDEFLSARMGITGANFAVAETGTIVLVENEGNIRFSTLAPPIHVAVMGIEKVIPRFEDLAVFLRLLPRSGTGQQQTAYVSFLNGPRHQSNGKAESENKSTDENTAETTASMPEVLPREFHLVIMDNGRTRILADEKMRESLHCIRCGACLNVCPVYQKIGGQAYGWIYPGPIGAVISPQLLSLKKAGELPFASSLCGACKDACPVKINLPDLLLELRGKVKTDEGLQPEIEKLGERAAMRGFAWAARFPKFFALAGRLLRLFSAVVADEGKIKQIGLPPLNRWTEYRDFPASPKKSFRDLWKEKGGDKHE
jgi:L-lactate dehydrogenase complex protein LldF